MTHGNPHRESDASATAGSSQPTISSGSSLNTSNVGTRSAQLQSLVDQAIERRVSLQELVSSLQANGATGAEATECVTQFEARLERQREKQADARPAPRDDDGDSDDSSDPQASGQVGGENINTIPQLSREQADALAWRLLKEKANAGRSEATGGLSGGPETTLDGVLSALLSSGAGAQPQVQASGIPAAVLAGAPHLNRHTVIAPDPHVAETWRLRSLYTSEGASGPLIDLAQQQILEVPLPRTIWKDIISDNFVNFEKLHAAMDPGYNHEDEAKDLAGGLAIIRKDHASAKKPLRTEGDWGRVYDAWMEGVKVFFPHRAEELVEYKKIVRELFRLMPDPLVPIQVDLGIRDSYSKNRFRLDDRNRHTIYISTQLSRTLFKGTKRPLTSQASSSPMSPAKRSATICRNWNLNLCPGDTCAHRRRHGVCAECGNDHKAIDQPACRAALQSKLGKKSA